MLKFILILGCASALAFGQGANGSITGTITDPGGAVIAGATVEARNTETGVLFATESTSTGNYTIPNLQVGTYDLTISSPGFKTYEHKAFALAARQIIREDVTLEVGATSESVTVTAEASLLKTETAEMAHNVRMDTLRELPLLGIGTANSGTTGVRNPYNSLQTLPGISSYASSGTFTLNGLGAAFQLTETMRVDGQDATSRLFGNYDYTQMAQPSVDSIEEVAYQTSNYAAEFGQAGIAVINMNMKSGTNQYHGSGYEYWVNEDLNAGNPFTISTISGGKMRPRNRRQDFGGTLGGPITIPKIYNGANRTFFFWNYEQFLETTNYALTQTLPTAAYLNGDFSAISPNGNCSLCQSLGIQTTALPAKDALGRDMFANTIYDPLTRGVQNGLGYANPFPNNQIPVSRFDPTTQKILALVPPAQSSNVVNNAGYSIGGSRYSAIPSIKIDHNISSKDKISFFYSQINTESQISSPLGGADGLPTNIGGYRGTFIPNRTTRLNYDRTISPTLLLHLGMGYFHTRFFDRAPILDFNPASIGLSGFVINRTFPAIQGNVSNPNLYGGLQNLGQNIQTLNYEEKPTFNANATWIHGNHTIKGGAELYLQQNFNGNFSTVTLNSGINATAQPFTPTGSLNGFSQGFGFASFLLGDYSATTQSPQLNYRQGQQVWGLFLQDTYKVTRKLTLDYGMRWDMSTPMKEQYGRLGQFDPNAPNANAGGHPGALLFAATCGCKFYQNVYPYGIGPRLGVAYQIDPKTVLRGGWGINYQFTGGAAGGIVSTNGAYPLAGINPYVNIQQQGSIVAPAWPIFDTNRYPVVGTVGNPLVPNQTPYMADANQNRPPRINQWSIGIQREVTRNFVVEASYVANRAAWINGLGQGTTLGYLSQISPQQFASVGLYPYPGSGPTGYDNNADRALLTQPLSAAAVRARGFGPPYAGFAGTSLLSSLYPFPQFGNLLPTGSPTGNSKYDSLQIKMTKRYSNGLQASASYTWAKGFSRPSRQDFWNPNSNPWGLQQIPPQVLTFNFTYTLQDYGLPKFATIITKDWEIGMFATYQSGQFLTPPTSTTANYLTSQDVRTGQPLYLKDINDIHNYNPLQEQVLNPAAWAQLPLNAVGPATSTFYNDFRGPRQPRENANIGRHFRFKERFDFYIRGEFVNIFNRTIMPNPVTTNPQNGPTRGAGNSLTNGFGVIQAYYAPNTYPQPTAGAVTLLGRTGTIIARLTF